MSEPTPEQQTAPEQTEQQTQGDPADKPLGENGEKALKAEREARAKAERQAAEFKAQIDAINQANLSDLEKAQQAAKEAQEQAQRAGTDALRYRIAAETGITENVDLILTAPDEETMRKQADLWGSRTSGTTIQAGPRADLSQGGNGAAAADPKAVFADFLQQMPG